LVRAAYAGDAPALHRIQSRTRPGSAFYIFVLRGTLEWLTLCHSGADPSYSPAHQGSPLEVRDDSFEIVKAQKLRISENAGEARALRRIQLVTIAFVWQTAFSNSSFSKSA
jgi:hypothetical protein